MHDLDLPTNPCQRRGIPLAVVVTGANRHDVTQVEAVLNVVAVHRPEPTPEEPQLLCADKAFDSERARALMEDWGYTLHVRSRGEERQEKASNV